VCCHAQTRTTGALVGSVLDPSGSAVPGATIRLKNIQTNQVESGNSNADGLFAFALLQPGDYVLDVNKLKFATLHRTGLHINVTETLRLELQMQLEGAREQIDVTANASLVQADSAALGHVVNEIGVQHLPLVTRNFTQIAVLSPGVTASVNNAMELGLGGGGLSQIEMSNDGIFVHGSRSYDNNFQIDGVSTSDVQGSSSASGGVPIPNPDTIQEFKMQTALYDASYGRYAGSNISIVSKSGSNALHGSVFEFFRNDALNANDYFRNRTDQSRGVLKQNQFGATVGGPIRKDRLFAFGSYQGTRQINGLAAGQARIACSVALSTPPLTDDRSPAALGALFGGMSGANGGVAVKSDGSNINPVALTLLNFKLPDGAFLIPSPQTVNPAKPFSSQGFSTFSEPCHFNEDQFTTNVDYIISQADRIAARFFFANDKALITFPGSAVNPTGNTRGFPGNSHSDFRVLSVSHTHVFGNATLNDAEVGYLHTATSTIPSVPFHWSDVGVTESEMNRANELPTLLILGSVSFAPAFPRTITQNSLSFSDTFSLLRGKHGVRFGGSIARIQDNLHTVGIGSFVEFLSWPDFLLGLNANENGTARFSNVFESLDNFGLLDREYRAWEGSIFGQDDYRVSKTITVNLGLRYERLGQFADELGRNSSFDVARADPNPLPEGSVAGYVAASNFAGTIPPGVFRASNEFGNYGEGQNLVAPRLGFAWRVVPHLSSFVLRGGYGLYFSRPTGQAFFQNVFSPPFSVTRIISGPGNASASFQTPFRTPFPTEDSFPSFPEYLPSTVGSLDTVSPHFRSAVVQQYGLNVQTELGPDWLFELGYVGTRGTDLQRFRSFNQAQPATPDHPVRGEVENTILNIPDRVPIVGFTPNGMILNESAGQSWYNGLEASLTKRLSRGLQFLASYTFSKTLDTDGANVNATSSGNAITRGDQNDPNARRGRVSFDRTHRFVFSTTYSWAGIGKGITHLLTTGWMVAGVVTVQSGSAMTVIAVNSPNIFGISQDRAQLALGCSPAQLVTRGSVQSKLSNYFNKACFTTPPIIGADGIGTDFGNSGTGIVNGPGQANADLSISRTIPLPFSRESNLLFRAEFFNAFNHPQFSNPDNNFSSPTFGIVQLTAVSPRVIQLALDLNF